VNASTAVLLGLGLPLLLLVIVRTERRGGFQADAFGSRASRWIAFGLLYGTLALTTLLPSARKVDPKEIRFGTMFTGHALLVLFLLVWWLLSGRPPLLDFLALRTHAPWQNVVSGLGLGVAGLAIGARISVDFGLTLRLLDQPLPTVPPLVRWIFDLPASQRLAVLVVSMTVEELFFRSFLQRRFGPVAASVLFLLSHGGYGEPRVFLGIAGITLMLSLGLYMKGNVLPSIAAHGLFNGVQLFGAPYLLRSLAR